MKVKMLIRKKEKPARLLTKVAISLTLCKSSAIFRKTNIPEHFIPQLDCFMANILVIDPSRSMRSTLKERLEYEGYRVEVAEDTISGMAACSHSHFDLLLCGQPDLPVRTAMPWIRLSHDNSTDSAVLAMQQGAVDFVPKPVDMNRLLGAIRRTLAARDAATVHEDRHVMKQEPLPRP